MADAMLSALATHFEVKLITSDSHFADLPGAVLLFGQAALTLS
jgi:hypothetical protein